MIKDSKYWEIRVIECEAVYNDLKKEGYIQSILDRIHARSTALKEILIETLKKERDDTEGISTDTENSEGK